MSFLFPWMLLGGLGISVPIAIHLLNRYRFKVVDWGAMELLRKALITQSRRIKIEDWLLMILRCLIILLLVLALARPRIMPTGVSWLGQGNDVGMVIAVDASFSMGHKPGAKSRFDRATDKVRELLKTLRPGNRVTLVLLGDRPHVLARNAAYDADRFDSILKTAATLPEGLDLDMCLDEVEALTKELSTPDKECYIISDMQQATWSRLTEKSRQTLKELAEGGRVFCMPIPSENSENLAITRFELKAGLLRMGTSARYEADVANTGSVLRKNIPVKLYLNNDSVDEGLIDELRPGETATISLYAQFDVEGPARLKASLDVADELALDNVRHAVADVRKKSRILNVRSPSAEASASDDVDYIYPALRGATEVDSVDPRKMDSLKLADYQTVILNNVSDLPGDQARNLYYYIKDGGNLVVFLGDNTEPGFINARFQHDKVPLLPAKIGDAVKDDQGSPIDPLDHPIARGVRGLSPELLGGGRVFRYFRTDLFPTAREVVKITKTEGALVAEKSLGRGKVILFTAGPDRNSTNLMTFEPGIIYPILLHEVLTFVNRQVHEQATTVSSSLVTPLPVKEDDEVQSVKFQPETGDPTTVSAVIRDGQVIAELPIAEQPGFYEIRDDQGKMSPLFAAVNVDPRESQVESLSADNVRDQLGATGVRVLTQGDSVEASVRESRSGREFWRQLLYLMLAVLVLEGILAWWFTQQKPAAD